MEKLLKNWDSEAGLLLFLCTVFGVGTGAIAFLTTTIGLKILDVCQVIGGLAVACLLIFYYKWREKRNLLVIKKRINIYFSFYYITKGEKLDEYLDRFKHYVEEKLSENGLKSVIKINYLSTEKKIGSKKEALKLIKGGFQGHTILVWGNFENIDDKVICDETNFVYEFNYNKRYSPEIAIQIFSTAINTAVRSLDWKFNLSSKDDVIAYIDNVFSVLLLILPRQLWTVREKDKSIQMFRNGIQRIENFNFDTQQKHGTILSLLKNELSEIFRNLAQEALHPDMNILMMEKYAGMSLTYNANNYWANLIMAAVKDDKDNDQTAAMKYISVAEKNRKGMGHDYLFSKAYIYLKIGKYPLALNIYNKLPKKDTKSNYLLLVKYIEDQYLRHPLPVLLFAEGYIRTIWQEEAEGKRKLKKFISITKGKQEYSLLINKAKSLC